MNTNDLLCSGSNCFDNNKFQLNFINGIVDHVSYKGLSIEQRPEVLINFLNLIENIQPKRIIEIGTFAGGLTLILKDIVDSLNLNTTIYTYDINSPIYLLEKIDNLQLKNIFINYQKNLFNSNYSDMLDDTSEIEFKNLIQGAGRSIILCDGGCKKCEFNIVSKFLKNNDIIMTHDYSPTSEYFQKHMYQKIWNWHEIEDSDILETMQTNNIVRHNMYNTFLKVAWGCFIKNNT